MSEDYKEYPIPKSLIGFAVRYYYRHKLRLRDVRDIMFDRSLEISHQTISDWIRDFGPLHTQAIRKTRGSSFQNKISGILMKGV